MTGPNNFPDPVDSAEAFMAQELKVYTLAEAQDVMLKPGDVIAGLMRADDYDRLESIAARQIAPSFNDSTALFARDPLGSMIRPPKFNGQLWGAAVVVPTDSQSLEKRRGRATFPLEAEQVVSLVISADMYTAGKKKPIGVSTREVIYFRRSSSPDPNHDPVSRGFGKRDTIKSATELARINHEAPAGQAERLAWLALRYTVMVRSRE